VTRARILWFGVLLLVAFGVAEPARAQSPDKQGWWSAANTGVGPANLFTPDVPEKGLLIQGGPSGPRAYAALVYAIAPGEDAGALTLEVTSSSITTPGATLLACPLVAATIEPASGGPMGDAPAYDCTHQVAATADGTTYRFDVSSLAVGDTLAVAILPSGLTDRVVFDEPGPDSLMPPAVPAPEVSSDAFDTPYATYDAGAASSPYATPDVAAPSAPAVARPQAATSPRPAAPFVPVRANVPEDAEAGAVIAALAAAALGSALWFGARRAAGAAVSTSSS
jgi:hypothetical protein